MRADRGFTLLEILIALVVLGFVLVMLTQGVQFGLQAWRAQARAMAERGDLDTVDRTLHTLIARMDPGDASGETRIRGDANSLSFTTDLPLATGLHVTRQADVSLVVDGAHRLVLLWLPHFRVWFGPPRVPERATLLEGVDRLAISYWQPASPGKPGGWLEAWTARDPPALVRIRIIFPPRSPRHWPDLVAQPMRERPRA